MSDIWLAKTSISGGKHTAPRRAWSVCECDRVSIPHWAVTPAGPIVQSALVQRPTGVFHYAESETNVLEKKPRAV